eukprot:Plantae.Rhodophyta-Palmaria_palmata.ctg21966.p1 GENE.Plantae.Rhodophyta-Palmaria_palmata.ctg21966~~Plantae.Rhodophyta-Palmaria_palmata.ctg21966.p1  ORF type:complete len:108 (+),score=5.32 Plantae.Rhodophyta-Palmaria_palmata.ctg21966:113-436(+)
MQKDSKNKKAAHQKHTSKTDTHEKEGNIADEAGHSTFVYAARALIKARRDSTKFPFTEGGNIDEEFKKAKRPYVAAAVKEQIIHLKERRKTGYIKKHSRQINRFHTR